MWDRAFNVGDLVLRLVQSNKDRHKLSPPWEGPYVITEVLHLGAYKLKTIDGKVFTNGWNIEQLLSNQFYYKHYYGRRATLSIGDVQPLCGILEGAIVCNVEHHIGDCGASIRASRDYAIMINCNPNNDTWTGGASRRRKAAMADGCL